MPDITEIISAVGDFVSTYQPLIVAGVIIGAGAATVRALLRAVRG